MVSLGCTICRGCQLDTCHVGIATQIDEEEARERGLKRFVPRVFDPSVDTLVRYFTEMGVALRELAGQMGVSDVQELVGQADRLVQVSHHDRLDLTSLLTPVRESIITAPAGTPRFFRPFHPPPPHRAPEVAAERLAAGSALAVEEETTTAADRNLGTDLAGLIARATTGVNNAWVNGADAGVSPTNGAAVEDPAGNNVGDGDVTASARNGGNGNGHRPTLVDLAFTKGAAVGSGLGAFTLDGVRIRVFGGAQDGVGKCALGGDIQVLKAQNALGELGRRPRGQELRLRRPARPVPDPGQRRRPRGHPPVGRRHGAGRRAGRPRSTTASGRSRRAPTARASRSST